MSTLTEIGDLLEAPPNSLGVAGDTLFIGYRPDSPDTVISVHQYPGDPPEYVQNSPSPNVEKVQIQVVARSHSYVEAETLAYRAWNKLASITNTTLGGTKYRSIRPNNSPGAWGVDSNSRTLIGFNATAEKEVSLVAS